MAAELAQIAAHAALIAAVALLSSRLSLPSRLLFGINTYLTQDSIPSPNPSQPPDHRLLRIVIVDSHLRSRHLFPDFRHDVISAVSAAASLSLALFVLNGSTLVPISVSIYSVAKILSSLSRCVSLSERNLSCLIGFAGFVTVIPVRSVLFPPISDFPSEIAIAVAAGSLAGVLFSPAARLARVFWLGTDQLRWELDFAVSGKFALILLYGSVLAGVAAPVAWIFSEFRDFGVGLLVGSAILKFLAIRVNLQTYLNEAVLSWYQMLHSGKVLDMGRARAKIFVINQNLCLVALQLFAPPALVILMVGLSRVTGYFSGTAIFFAWWISFVEAVVSLSALVWLRCGFLIIS